MAEADNQQSQLEKTIADAKALTELNKKLSEKMRELSAETETESEEQTIKADTLPDPPLQA